MKEISEWIKKKYKFVKMEGNSEYMWCCCNGIVGFLYKNSYFCNELRKGWNYIPHTFQYFLDHCKFKEDLVFFNDRIVYNYPLLEVFIWMFNPKHVIIEISLDKDEPSPMIFSAPDIPFEMFIAPMLTKEEQKNLLKD